MNDDGLDDVRARLARTCPACGVKSVENGRCTTCGAPKLVVGEPWKVSKRTPATVAAPVPPRVDVNPAMVLTPRVESTAPARPSVARTRAARRQAGEPPQSGSLF